MTGDIETRRGLDINTLVVFYSRTGRTRALAHAIAESLHADLEELAIVGESPGRRSYLHCVLDGLLGGHVDLALPRHNPNAYDVVVIATPVWSGSVSSPVRTYLAAQDGRLRRVAFAVTAAGGSARRVYAQLRRLAGLTPIATMAIPDSERGTAALAERLERFADAIRSRVNAPPAVHRDQARTVQI